MDSSSDDSDDSGGYHHLNPLEIADLAEINDESFESEMIESHWDDSNESFEHELEEMSELLGEEE